MERNVLFFDQKSIKFAVSGSLFILGKSCNIYFPRDSCTLVLLLNKLTNQNCSSSSSSSSIVLTFKWLIPTGRVKSGKE